MEYCILTIMWLVFLLTILILPTILFLIFGRKRKKRSRAALISLILLAFELFTILLLCAHPPIINLTVSKLTEDSKEIIRDVSRGRFNDNTPTFPIAVIVTENANTLLRWRTFYGIWGSTEHIWDGIDKCYEMTDPLWRW